MLKDKKQSFKNVLLPDAVCDDISVVRDESASRLIESAGAGYLLAIRLRATRLGLVRAAPHDSELCFTVTDSPPFTAGYESRPPAPPAGCSCNLTEPDDRAHRRLCGGYKIVYP